MHDKFYFFTRTIIL